MDEGWGQRWLPLAKVTIPTAFAIPFDVLDAALITVGVIHAKTFAVSLLTILAIGYDVAFVTLSVNTHLAIHHSLSCILHVTSHRWP